MSRPRILLTGGSGFVGQAILRQFLQRHRDWPLTVADLEPPQRAFAEENGIRYLRLDVKDVQQCLDVVKAADPVLIIHAAGRVPGGLTRYGRKGIESLFLLNVGGTENMLKAAKTCNVPNFIFTGSCTSITDDFDHEYPNFNEEVPYPLRSTMYGESKVHKTGVSRNKIIVLTVMKHRLRRRSWSSPPIASKWRHAP